MGQPLKHIIVAGQQFGNWVVLENRQVGNLRVLARCKCGLEISVLTSHLISGDSKGCNKCRLISKGSDSNAWTGTGLISGRVFWRLQYNANKRNIPFSITLRYLVELFNTQLKKCALTGRFLSFGDGNYYGKDKTASLDRIDSSRGYVDGNVQWVHKDVNVAKQSLSQQDFIKLCKEVIDHSKTT